MSTTQRPDSSWTILACGALSLSLTAGGGCVGQEYDGGFSDNDYDSEEGEVAPEEEGYYDEGYFDGPYYDEGYYNPTTTTWEPTTLTSVVTSEPVTTDMTASSSTGTETTGTGSTTGSTGTGSTGTGSGTETTGTGSSGSSSGSTTGGVDVNFPEPGVFGDDVQELDLVGVWSLQWAPDATTWDSVLSVDASGDWVWRETSADCTSDALATGFLWVEPGQIVMHVETWERQLPWDTAAIAGQEFPPPFRLRMTYALLGPNLALAGTDRLVEAAPYEGRAYLQTAPVGIYIAGQWHSEAELMAAFDGAPDAVVVVRDRFMPTLDVEPGVTPESTGIVVHDQTYWGLDPPVATPTIFENGNWTCLNGCPQPAGATLIAGGNLYAYGPYAGYQRLMTFASGRSFRRDVDTDCP